MGIRSKGNSSMGSGPCVWQHVYSWSLTVWKPYWNQKSLFPMSQGLVYSSLFLYRTPDLNPPLRTPLRNLRWRGQVWCLLELLERRIISLPVQPRSRLRQGVPCVHVGRPGPWVQKRGYVSAFQLKNNYFVKRCVGSQRVLIFIYEAAWSPIVPKKCGKHYCVFKAKKIKIRTLICFCFCCKNWGAAYVPNMKL